MSAFKPFRASDHLKHKDDEVSSMKFLNNQDAIDAVLDKYPKGQLGYGRIVFGCGGNSFCVDYGEGCNVDMMNETVKDIDLILESFGLRSQKEVDHYVAPPVKYFLVRIEDA